MAKSRDLSWANALASACANQTESVPDGWETTKSLAEKENVSLSTVERKLAILIAQGRVEMKRFRINSGQRIQAVPHYKLK